jgi:nucleotide-binding universal stress UspA family protein
MVKEDNVYTRILVALENSASDRAVIDHIARLATLTGASVLLVHVADGWAARHFVDLELRESQEMREDRAYLDDVATELRGRGLHVDARLALGDPASEICRTAETAGVDLIAMSTHGHRFIKDVLLGATADKVRHLVKIPVLLVRAP